MTNARYLRQSLSTRRARRGRHRQHNPYPNHNQHQHHHRRPHNLTLPSSNHHPSPPMTTCLSTPSLRASPPPKNGSLARRNTSDNAPSPLSRSSIHITSRSPRWPRSKRSPSRLPLLMRFRKSPRRNSTTRYNHNNNIHLFLSRPLPMTHHRSRFGEMATNPSAERWASYHPLVRLGSASVGSKQSWSTSST